MLKDRLLVVQRWRIALLPMISIDFKKIIKQVVEAVILILIISAVLSIDILKMHI
jgi:hypothetical protein